MLRLVGLSLSIPHLSPATYRKTTPLPPTPGRSGGPVQKCPLMRSVRFTPLPVLLILLTLALAASPALAAGGRGHRAESVPGLFSAVWQALGELVPWLGASRETPAGKLGSAMDPDGPTTSACPGDLGSTMDPDGCPTSQSGSDLGSIMDPDG